MKYILTILIVAVVVVGAYYLFAPGTDGPEVSPSPTPTVSRAASPSASPAQGTPTQTPSPTLTPSLVPSASKTPTPTPTSQSQTHSVTINNYSFAPSSLTVKRGDTVVFTNQDSVIHTATADGGAFDSGNLSTNGSFTLDTSVLAPGSYPYHCTPHPFMKATLIVQ